MLKQHKEKLRNNHVQQLLVNEMNGESIIQELYKQKCISQSSIESLLSYKTRKEFPFIVPRLDRVRGAIVVSGKNLCLSVTQFSVVCNSETVEEIDTKLVLSRLQHL